MDRQELVAPPGLDGQHMFDGDDLHHDDRQRFQGDENREPRQYVQELGGRQQRQQLQHDSKYQSQQRLQGNRNHQPQSGETMEDSFISTGDTSVQEIRSLLGDLRSTLQLLSPTRTGTIPNTPIRNIPISEDSSRDHRHPPLRRASFSNPLQPQEPDSSVLAEHLLNLSSSNSAANQWKRRQNLYKHASIKKELLFDPEKRIYEDWLRDFMDHARSVVNLNDVGTGKLMIDFLGGTAKSRFRWWISKQSDHVTIRESLAFLSDIYGLSAPEEIFSKMSEFTLQGGESIEAYGARYLSLKTSAEERCMSTGRTYRWRDEEEVDHYVKGLEHAEGEFPGLQSYLLAIRAGGNAGSLEAVERQARNFVRSSRRTPQRQERKKAICAMARRAPSGMTPVSERRTTTNSTVVIQDFAAEAIKHNTVVDAMKQVEVAERKQEDGAREGKLMGDELSAEISADAINMLTDRISETGDHTADFLCSICIDNKSHRYRDCARIIALMTTSTNRTSNQQIQCFGCGGNHYVRSCPSVKNKADTNRVRYNRLRMTAQAHADQSTDRWNRQQRSDGRQPGSSWNTRDPSNRRSDNAGRNNINRTSSNTTSGWAGRPSRQNPFDNSRYVDPGFKLWSEHGRGDFQSWRKACAPWGERKDNQYLPLKFQKRGADCSFHFWPNQKYYHSTSDCSKTKKGVTCAHCGGLHFNRFCGWPALASFTSERSTERPRDLRHPKRRKTGDNDTDGVQESLSQIISMLNRRSTDTSSGDIVPTQGMPDRESDSKNQ
jgi:hypothetical protein